MDYSTLKEVFQAFASLKVVILGDVMLDSYIYGKAERISPEAPVPIVHVNRREQRLGGAANVALNVAALGANPVLCSIIGNDLGGDAIVQLLDQARIPSLGIIRSVDRITTIKERVLAGSQHMLRVDTEINHELNRVEENSLISQVSKLAKDADVVIFQDYDKGAINPVIIKKVVEFCNENGILTVVDPKKNNFLNYNQVSLFKPNLKELREGMKVDLDIKERDQIIKEVARLRSRMSFDLALVTLSEHGMLLYDGQDNHFLSAHVRSISDVSGAGDTVISIAALGLAVGINPKLMAELANLGGGLVCEHLGVVPINKRELLSEAVKNGLGKMLSIK